MSAGRSPTCAVGWNEGGLALQVEVRGKEQVPVGDVARPRHSDGVTVWIDTRDARASHRASRSCHQFHFLVAGSGADRDEPAFVQSKINRALHDAPLVGGEGVPFQFARRSGGYRLEAFLPASASTASIRSRIPAWGFMSPSTTGTGRTIAQRGRRFPLGRRPQPVERAGTGEGGGSGGVEKINKIPRPGRRRPGYGKHAKEATGGTVPCRPCFASLD